MSINQAVTPLRMIFWGTLLCILDFKFILSGPGSGVGFQFDILNDFVGMLMITIAMFSLSQFVVDASYKASMQFILGCCLINCVTAFAAHFILATPSFLTLPANLLGIATLCAAVLFCSSMQALSNQHSLHRSSASWATTRLLVIVIWLVPLSLIYLMSTIAVFTGQSFEYQLGYWALPFLLVFLVPLVHSLVSMSRMKSEASQPLAESLKAFAN